MQMALGIIEAAGGELYPVKQWWNGKVKSSLQKGDKILEL